MAMRILEIAGYAGIAFAATLDGGRVTLKSCPAMFVPKSTRPRAPQATPLPA